MKATKKTIPALLSDATQPSSWVIKIKTRHEYAELICGNKQMADFEFRRIKVAGTFGGQWITDLRLEEQKGSEDDITSAE